MELIVDFIKLLAMICVASVLVGVSYSVILYIRNRHLEEINVKRYRELENMILQFIERSRRVGEEFPHIPATGEWLKQNLGYAKSIEGNLRDVDQFKEDLRKIELPQVKKKTDELNRLKARVDDLDQIVRLVRDYKTRVERLDRITSRLGAPPEELKEATESKQLAEDMLFAILNRGS